MNRHRATHDLLSECVVSHPNHPSSRVALANPSVRRHAHPAKSCESCQKTFHDTDRSAMRPTSGINLQAKSRIRCVWGRIAVGGKARGASGQNLSTIPRILLTGLCMCLLAEAKRGRDPFFNRFLPGGLLGRRLSQRSSHKIRIIVHPQTGRERYPAHYAIISFQAREHTLRAPHH